jgi:hypothetical protein
VRAKFIEDADAAFAGWNDEILAKRRTESAPVVSHFSTSRPPSVAARLPHWCIAFGGTADRCFLQRSSQGVSLSARLCRFLSRIFLRYLNKITESTDVDGQRQRT